MKTCHKAVFLSVPKMLLGASTLLLLFGSWRPASASLPGSVAQSTSALSNVTTVFVILEENHDWAAVKDSASAPYINNVLLPMASYASEYFNPPRLHPSEPNYLWLEAGDNFGVKNDDDPTTNHFATKLHLVTLLENKGITWKSYQESISGKYCPVVSAGGYAAKHNPMVFFDDVTDTNDPNSAHCMAHIRPYKELSADLSAGTVAQYNFITPDECDDMHNSAGCVTPDSVANGDKWLLEQVPMILNSDAFKKGGALFITWDEGTGLSDGPIGLILVSPFAKGGGYTSALPYTHSSLLRTLQEIFNVTPLLGDAANAADLSDLFKLGS